VVQDREFESDFDREERKMNRQGKEKIMRDAGINFKEA
jgi:hypothetical protein